MKLFEINGKKIEFDIWEELTVKELRKITPFIQWAERWSEVEMTIWFAKALSVNAEETEATIDSFTMEEFEKFGEFIWQLIDIKKKMIV